MIIIPKEAPQDDKFLDSDSAVTDGIYVVPDPEHKIYHLRDGYTNVKASWKTFDTRRIC